MSRTLNDDKFDNQSQRLLLPGEDLDEYGLPGPIQGRTYHRWETWRDNQKDRMAQGLPFSD